MRRLILIAILGFGLLIFRIPVAASQPANDLCANATEITGSLPQSIAGSTTSATFDDVGLCGTSNTTSGVWYTIVGTGNLFTASTCNAADYDTKLSVFSNGCGTLTCVTGRDDSAGCAGFTTEVDWLTTAGEVYHILVHGYESATGDFTLTLNESIPPPNDDVCSAESISVSQDTRSNPTPFDNTGATAQPGEVSPGAGTGLLSCNTQDGWCSYDTEVQSSLWYTFKAPCPGSVTIVATKFDTQLALWEAGDCDDFLTFTEIAANDDSGDDVIPGIHIFAPAIIEATRLNPGQTYYIQLDGFDGERGSGYLHLIDIDSGNEPECIKEGAIEDLAELLSQDEGDDDLIQAIGYINMSLGRDDPRAGMSGSDVVWGDNNHVDACNGGNKGADVFQYEQEACDKLDGYLENDENADFDFEDEIEEVRQMLAEADEILAATAISDAIAEGGKPDDIADAEDLKAEGDAAWARGGSEICDVALDKYEEAWEKAVKSWCEDE